jgi:hypothetical protein
MVADHLISRPVLKIALLAFEVGRDRKHGERVIPDGADGKIRQTEF